MFTENQRSCHVINLVTYLRFIPTWLVNAVPHRYAYANGSIAVFIRLVMKLKDKERSAAEVTSEYPHRITPPAPFVRLFFFGNVIVINRKSHECWQVIYFVPLHSCLPGGC